MHQKFIIPATIVLLLFSACEQNNEENSIESGAKDSFSLVYVKGSAWTNYSYKAELNQSGELYIEVNGGIFDTHRKSEYQISNDTIALVHEKILEATRIDINSNYGFGTNNPYDLPVTLIKYRMGIHADSTAIYNPTTNELPEELQSLLSLIEIVIRNK